MKAKELRIGNYYLDIDNKLSELSGSELHQMTIKENNDNLGVMEYQPIPLTEEWLLKFGFEKDTDDSFIFNSLAVFLDKRFKKNVFILTSEYSKNWFEIDLKIKHVHQLQNLYFALSGKELTI